MKKDQPALRLVFSQRSRCSSNSLNAASPLGAPVRSCSISLTDEGASPIKEPISERVSPVVRSSLMRDDQVSMLPTLREPVDSCQRPPVTELRQNWPMPRPPGLPKFSDIGPRVRWWREHRGHGRQEFAKLVDMPYSTLADLENNRTKAGKYLHLIAARLRLNAYYLQTDKGEPEAEYAQEAPEEGPEWPFPDIPITRFGKLNRIERNYAQDMLERALEEIDAERRKAKKQG